MFGLILKEHLLQKTFKKSPNLVALSWSLFHERLSSQLPATYLVISYCGMFQF